MFEFAGLDGFGGFFEVVGGSGCGGFDECGDSVGCVFGGLGDDSYDAGCADDLLCGVGGVGSDVACGVGGVGVGEGVAVEVPAELGVGGVVGFDGEVCFDVAYCDVFSGFFVESGDAHFADGVCGLLVFVEGFGL